MGQLGESSAFGVVESQATVWEFGFEDAIFFFKVGDDALLMAIDPAGGNGDENFEYHVSDNPHSDKQEISWFYNRHCIRLSRAITACA
jgi:hypothetical protein